MKIKSQKFASALRFGLIGVLLGSAARMSLGATDSPIPLTSGSTYTQDFDSIGTTATATVPSGFAIDRPGTVRTVGTYAAAGTATERVGGAALSSTATNGIYNFGSGTGTAGADRALGFVSAGSATQSGDVYAQFINNTGGPLASFNISFDVEKYRTGSNVSGFRVEAFYSADDTSSSYVTTNLKATFPADTSTANGPTTAPISSTTVTGTVTPATPIPNGNKFYLAFNYSVAAGSTISNAQALAVDNFSITAGGTAPTNNPPTFTGLTITPTNPTTNATLTANPTATDPDTGDTLTYTYVWKKNGTAITGETGSTLDLSKLGNGDKGDAITVTATVSDGKGGTDTRTSDPVTILNSAPTVSNVTIAPSSPTTNSTLSITIGTLTDPDGDTVTPTYVWKKNGTAIAGETGATLNLATAGNGDKGDQITVTVTANDGTTTSSSTSSAVTIGNSAPSISSVTITPNTPTTNSTLTANVTATDADSDTITYSYVWKKNGTAIAGQTGAILDLSVAGNGDAGDTITVTVIANDGTDNSTAVTSSAVTVGNTAPVISAVTITPNSPTTNSTLTANVTASDADTADTLTYTYVWKKNGTTIAGETGATLDLSTAGNGDKGDSITVTVTANDGTANSIAVTSSSVTVGNTAPVISSVTITPNSPTTNSTVTANVAATDADTSDTLTYTYVWKKNGTVIAGETGNTLNLATAGNGDNGDTITVTVTANDGTTSSTAVTSDGVLVGNNPPVISSVTIAPTNPTTNSTLTATVAASDEDSDTLTTTYVWKKNGTVIAGETGSTLDLSVAGNGDKGDSITVTATVSDGKGGSDSQTSTAVTVQNSAPVISSVTITPTNPNTDSTLTANVTATDADNDTLTYTYVWKKNGTAIAGETGNTLNLATAGNGNNGDTITVAVTANDGTANSAAVTSDGVTIANSAPVISSVTLAPTSPKTNDTLTATVNVTDADAGDALTTTYVWTKNGTTIAGETGSTLDLSVAGNGDRGNTIRVTATVSDGKGGSDSQTSTAVAIGNSAPVISSVTITPTNPQTDDVVTANVTASDADNDTLAYSYVWKKNGTTIAGQTGKTLNLATAGNGDAGDTITVTVTVNDGTVSSTAVTSSNITVSFPNRTPVVVSITPASSTDTVGNSRTFTLTVSDADGVGDIKNVWLLANTVLGWGNGITLVYDKVNNQLMLRDGDHFNGPITPGSGTLSNGAATIDGSSVTVTATSATTLALTFTAQTKVGMRGANKLFGRVEDMAGTVDATSPDGQFGFVQKGDWAVNAPTETQKAPVAAVSPGAKGTSTNLTVGTEFNLTVDLTDANGLADIDTGYILVNDAGRLTWGDGFTLYYEAKTNRLYLRSTDGNSFLGGDVVGQGTGTIGNDAGSVRLAGCSATPITNGVRLVIPVTLKGAFAKTKQVWSRIQDVEGNVASDSDSAFGYKTEGLWVISNPADALPQASVQVGGQSAANGTSQSLLSGQETTFTLNLSDADGAGDIDDGWILINAPKNLSWQNGITLVYEAKGNLLRLRSTDGNSFQDAVLGTTTGTLSNDAVTVRLSGTTITKTATGITLTIAVTPKAAFAGTRQIWSRVQDTAGNVQANNDATLGFNTEGTLDITVPGGTGGTGTGSGGMS